MESSEALTRTNIRGVLALFEVLVVALAGPVLVQIGFMVSNVGRTHILGDARVLFLFMAAEASIALFLIILFLRTRAENLRKLGLIRKNVGREALWGLSCVPFLFLSTFLVSIFFSLLLPQYVSASNPLLELIRDSEDLILFLISSIYVGGIKEEIQRAFILDRFERYLGPIFLKTFLRLFAQESSASEQAGRRVGITVGLILWSLFFAAGHALQGVDNAVGAGILGICFGLLYLWRRNLMAPMLAHALYDVTTLLAFWFFLSG